MTNANIAGHSRLCRHGTTTRVLLCSWGLSGLPAVCAETVVVDPSVQYQVWRGWGVSLSWWAAVVGGWSEEKREAVADLLFDRRKGLCLDIVRYNIGGQDDPSHDHMRVGGDIPGYWPGRDEAYDWSADGNQRRMLSAAMARGVETVEAFACSPPYWMTVSGCSAGAEEAHTDNLKEDNREIFAEYLTEVLRHFRDEWDVSFSTVAPFNEPAADYWKAGTGQQGCHYSADAQNDLLRLVAGKLKQKRLATELTAGDETCTEHCVRSFRSYDQDVRAAVKQINTHTYNSSWDRAGPRYLADMYGKRLCMSEICFASKAPGKEHDHEAMKGPLDVAGAITRDLREMRPDAWVLWQPLVNEQYCIWWKFSYGLIHADYTGGTETWDITRKYYGYGQFTRFIRPGYRMIGIDAEDAVGFLDRPTGRLVVVAHNPGPDPRTRHYDLSSFMTVAARAEAHRTSATEALATLPPVSTRGKRLVVVEPPESISTYVVRGVSYQGPAKSLPVWVNDDNSGAGENQFEYIGHWDYTDLAPGAFVSDNHWSGRKDDAYKVRFSGVRILLYGAIGPNLGIAGVSIDDGPETRVDFYAASRTDQHLVYSSPPLPPGEHTLTVRVTGERHEKSTHLYIPADRVDVVPGPTGR